MFLPVAALAPYFAGRYATELGERTRKAAEPDRRRAHDLLTLARRPGPMMEIRLAGHGSVTEQGSHAELMAAGGPYSSFFDLQARGYRV